MVGGGHEELVRNQGQGGVGSRGGGDDKEVVILGRIVRWENWGIELEADPKHRNILSDYFGFTRESGPVLYNGDRERREEPEDDVEMDRKEAKEFRGLTARLNYVAQDAPGLQYRAK